jgi:hypothetical protein
VNGLMGYGCCGTGFQKSRSFLTKEERIAMLKEYKDELEKEGKGVVEKIKGQVDITLLSIFEQSKILSNNRIILAV